VDLEGRVLHVAWPKKGLSTTHPLRADEIHLLRAWLKERERMGPESDALFISERRGPLNRRRAWDSLRKYGEKRAAWLAHLLAS
jgi:type 1 fimbriae regulatory protein FimB